MAFLKTFSKNQAPPIRLMFPGWLEDSLKGKFLIKALWPILGGKVTFNKPLYITPIWGKIFRGVNREYGEFPGV